MFVDRASDKLVIIDCNSCAVQGSRIPNKRLATPGGVFTAEFENDFFGLIVF
jgi:hypothetical protein